jgi:hypothetical protein
MAEQELSFSERNNLSIKSELKNMRKELSWLNQVRERHLHDVRDVLV